MNLVLVILQKFYSTIKEKSDIWMRAAVLGSIWASIEIIVGNFLHGFRLPFTGEILTFFAIYFLTASSVRWKVKGLIWRAGLICAMMKFFTPGVKVFGPIIGIVSESFMFEIVLRVFGMNAIGFILGGGLTLCLPLVQKLINLLILYGWNLLVVFDKSVEFFLKLINIHNTDSLFVLLILFGINFIFGSVAAILGYLSGRKKVVFKNDFSNELTIKPAARNQSQEGVGLIFLKLIINAAIITLILLFFKDNLILCSILTMLFISYVLFRYKSSRRIFRNYKLWLQIAVFTGLTTLVLTFVMKSDFNKSVLTGIEMFMRVLLITTGFHAISSEISNTAFKTFLYSKLNRNFSEALNLAFAAVPEIINSSKGITSILNPGKFIDELTNLTDVWHERFKAMSNKILIITGSQGKGKTTYLEKIIDSSTIGVYSKVVYENNVRIGYDALLINSNKVLPLCRINYESDIMLGKFGFYEETFRIITDDILGKEMKDYSIVVDEIGLLEREKKGWYELMKWSLGNINNKLVFSVRKEILDVILDELDGRDYEILDLDLKRET